jgi:GNAT superfamily N-acetyltransferase
VSTAIDIRLLVESDIPAAMQLKEAAGWNQTEDDWRCLLKLEPCGCFGAFKAGRLVGTTTTTTYGDALGWIGMVLVDPQHRRQGFAAKLMVVALEYLKVKVATIKLDATALGKPVYEKFGFEVESLIERWSGVAATKENGTRSDAIVNSDELFALDQLAFNADRSRLLAELISRASVSPVLSRAGDGSLIGYALARSGTKADYIGPLIANDSQQVDTLLGQVLSQLGDRRVYIDFNTECGTSASVLSERGFVKERDLIRMRAGGPGAKTSPLVVAIAGPEIG